MRSPNPLVAIGITTLVTVGAVYSGAAHAAPPDSATANRLEQSGQASLDKEEASDRPIAQTTEPSENTETNTSAESTAATDTTSESQSLAEDENPATPAETPSASSSTPETEAIEDASDADPSSEQPSLSETPASEPSDAPTAQAAPLEVPTTEVPATETPADEPPATETPTTGTSTPETATAETATPDAVTQPAPVETPAENTLTEPPPETPATETPETDTPEATPAETAPAATTSPSRVDVPDYLNPSPNPLDFPTRPEEVQLQGTQPITLRQAVDLAIRNNPQLRQVRQQLDQAQAQLDQSRAANNPTVSVNSSLVQAGQESPVTVPPTTLGGSPTTEIRSSDAATLQGNLEVNYALFTSGRRSSLIRAAEGQVRVQQLEIERQTNDLILQVATAYYDLQQAGAQVRIFQSNLEQAQQSLRDAEALERAGVGTRFDVLQAQVDVANAQQELTQQLSTFDVSRRNLGQLLNVANGVDLTSADPIEVAGDWNFSLEQSIVEAFKNRAELEQQLIQRESAEEQRQAALAQLGPQVNLQGSFGLTNNLDAGNGFLNNYQVGVGLSLNLYDGGAARAQARQQETQIAQAESQFENLQDQIRFQTEQAYSQLQASATNITTTALAVQQAAEALRLARLRFQAGVGTQTDVLRQQTVLAQSQVNNLQAILGYNRALVTLQRQVSNLPEGFLSDTP
ncbi:TolC family protein [Leptolyngbya ohadii]|uniref:TolC family protein n=1 Tax=Leptolyngbya ohadii TaxID=1962290 RepID=UPI000B59B887|nr:TolC family protein [Leptolyngbya ohadii]